MRTKLCIAALSMCLAPMAFAQMPEASKTPPQNQDQPLTSPGAQATENMKTGGKYGMNGMDMNTTPITVADATSDQEKQFITNMSDVNMAEVKIGQLTATNADNDSVKKYGQMLVDDHTKAEDQLRPIAQKYGVDLSDQLDPVHQAVYDKLSKKQGQEFDMAFAFAMAGGHTEALYCAEFGASHEPDADVKGYASDMIPHLKAHLHMAKEISSQFTGNMGDEAQTAGGRMEGADTGNANPSNVPENPANSQANTPSNPVPDNGGTPNK
jgi:putative membrane protein